MAITTTRNGDGTWTITPDTASRKTFERAEKDHSATILAQVLEGWERGEREMIARQDAEKAKATLDTLTDAEKTSIPPDIRTKLGL